MAFQTKADLQNQAIGWLRKGYSSLGGGTVVSSLQTWRPSGECRLKLDLSGGSWKAEYRCGEDLYRGRFAALGADGWSAQWVITGPRKDQRLDSLYTRVRAA